MFEGYGDELAAEKMDSHRILGTLRQAEGMLKAAVNEWDRMVGDSIRVI